MSDRFPELRFRQIHLDFHTSEEIPGIGSKFDEDEFIASLRQGHVDSVTMFALGHHGWAYFDSAVAAPHPHLKTNLLERMLAACKKVDVDAPIYITVGWNEKEGREHPEWCHVDRDGKLLDLRTEDGSPLTPEEANAMDPEARKPWGWRRLCVNTPYLDYLLEVTREVMEKFAPVGIFYDITGETPCFCKYCRRDMAEQGVDMDDPEAVQAFATEVYRTYMRKTTEVIWSVKPDARVYHNSSDRKGRDDLYPYFSHYEIESLPTSFWGYEHFPLNSHYFLPKGMDFLGMTGKFHVMWGEFGGYKWPAALQYECARMLALGAKCSIGDQMLPDGRLDPETYRVIGEAYRYVEEREKWCSGVESVADIGVLCPSTVLGSSKVGHESEMGAVMMLNEIHALYDMLDPVMDFAKYRVIILPDCVPVDAELKAKLDAFVAAGGSLILSHESGLDAAESAFQIDCGCEFGGSSDWDIDYTLVTERIAANMVSSPFYNSEPGVKTSVTDGEVLATTIAPYFSRTFGHFCSHGNTPPSGDDAGYPSVVRKGNVIYLAQPIFKLYADRGMKLHRDLVANCLGLLMPQPTLELESFPSGGLVSLLNRPEHGDTILHLVYSPPMKRGSIQVVEDMIPLRNVEAVVRNQPKIKTVRLLPEGMELPFEQHDDTLRLKIPEFTMHAMIQIVR